LLFEVGKGKWYKKRVGDVQGRRAECTKRLEKKRKNEFEAELYVYVYSLHDIRKEDNA